MRHRCSIVCSFTIALQCCEEITRHYTICDPLGLWLEVAGPSIIPYYTERIRGAEVNDIFVVGDFGIVAHYNGISWKLFPQVAAADVYNSVDYNGTR